MDRHTNTDPNWERGRFSLKDHNHAKSKRMCICSNFNRKSEAVAPFNRSCPYHGERQG